MAYGTLPDRAINGSAKVERSTRTRNDEGEGADSWSIVHVAAPCRLEVASAKLMERWGGAVTKADFLLWFRNDVTLLADDRVTVEMDAGKTHVVRLTEVIDAAGMGHHFEATADRMAS